MDITFIQATTLPDAWFQCVYRLLKGENVAKHVYQIEQGSYVGQKRIEFDFAVVQINHPGVEPLIPDIPAQMQIPPPVESMEYVHNYCAKYLLDDSRLPNETYRYSNWLARGLERVKEHLRQGRNTNQTAINIGSWLPLEKPSLTDEKNRTYQALCLDTDAFIDPGTEEHDPACMRLVDFRVDQSDTLHLFVYFRSWDLWSGFPANLAGLQLMKFLLAEELELQDGKIIAASKGLHIYDHAYQVAAARVGMDPAVDLAGFIEFVDQTRKKG